MRNVFTLASLAAVAALSACNGETCSDGSKPVDDECPCADGTYPSDNESGTCSTVLECGTGEIDVGGECKYECDDGSTAANQEACPANLNPIAVGFEYDGGWDGEELVGYVVDDGAGGMADIPAVVLVTFANEAYFTQGGSTDTKNSCEAFAFFDVIAATSELHVDSGTVWTEFDTTMTIAPGSWDFDEESCAAKLDAAVWGENGEDLLASFTLFRFGMGFGPLTTNLAAYWQNEDGDWSSDEIAELAPGLFTEYIAINDAQGNFVLEDWTTGLAFEFDPETGEIPSEPGPAGAVLIAQDLTGAGSLPPSYIRSFAYWYQDFPLMDLSNLGDGRPVGR